MIKVLTETLVKNLKKNKKESKENQKTLQPDNKDLPRIPELWNFKVLNCYSFSQEYIRITNFFNFPFISAEMHFKVHREVT